MRILQISTIITPLLPELRHGAIERLVYQLDREYVARDHDSVVACTGDSRINGRVLATYPRNFRSLYPDRSTTDYDDEYEDHFERVVEEVRQNPPDVIHDHTFQFVGSRAFREANDLDVPVLTTLHGIATLPRKQKYYQRLIQGDGLYYSGISQSQADSFRRFVHADEVVYNGIDVDSFTVGTPEEKLGYLFLLSRITPGKGQEEVISAARSAGKKLVLAGNVQDPEYFEGLEIDHVSLVNGTPVGEDYVPGVIEPLVNSQHQVVFLGELNDAQKMPWYQHSDGFIFYPTWEEPFGLVIPESLAAGRPVIAARRGGIPEILDEKSGILVDSEEELARAIERLDEFDPEACRSRAEEFSTGKMADNYLVLYERLVKEYAEFRRSAKTIVA